MAEKDTKKRSLEETSELAHVRAFAEIAFPVWVKRIPSEKIAKLVGELAMRWSVAGHNVPTVAGALHAEVAIKFKVDQMLDLIVAWEDINECQYDPALGKSVKNTPKEEVLKSPLKHSGKKKSAADLEKKIAELEEHVKKAEKQAERSCPDKEFCETTVRKLRERKEGLAEWMLTSLDMVSAALESTISDEEPAIPAEEVWK